MEEAMTLEEQVKKEITLKEICYFLFFGILSFAKGIGLYDGQKVFVLLLLLAGFFWLLKVCLTRHTVKELVMFGVLLLLAGLSYWNSGNKASVIAVMVITGMKDISVKRLFKVGAFIWFCAFVGATTASHLGIWPTTQFVHNKGALGYVVRDALGMTHPNVLHISYMVLIAYLFLAYDWKGKDIIKPIVGSLVGSIYFFTYSLSYTGFIFLIVYLILIIYFNLPRKISKTEKIIIQCLMPFCVLFSLLGPLVLSGKVFDFVNKLVNTRFSLSRYYLTNVKPMLIGQPLRIGETYSVDCSYVYCLYYYGILLFVFFVSAIFFLIRFLLKKERKQELAVVLGQVAAGFTEPFLFNFAFKNLIFPLLGEYCFYLSTKFLFKGKLQWLENSFQIIPLERKFENRHTVLEKNIKLYIKTVLKHKRKYLVGGAILGMMLGLLVCNFIPEPEPYIIADKSKCDRVGGKYDYLIYGNISQEIKDHSMKINVKDENTKVYVFSGTTVAYLEFQNKVSVVVYSALGGSLVVAILLGFVYRKEEEQS